MNYQHAFHAGNFADVPRVLDSNYRLVGERGNQFNLLLGKRSNFGACQSKNPDDIALAKQRNAQNGVVIAKFQGLMQLVIRISLGVENMSCRATERSPANQTAWSWFE